MTRPHVLLIGGGHAHLHVIRAFQEQRWRARCTLVSSSRSFLYSGMVPGYLQGTYTREEMEVDLGELCAGAGVEFIEATVQSVDAQKGIAEAELRRSPAGRSLHFDLASVDVGSVPRGLDVPGVGAHAVPLRPLSRIIGLRDTVDRLMAETGGRRPLRMLVVGAGAAGFEIALALHRRAAEGGGRPHVTLADAGDRILAGYSDRARRLAERLLIQRGITVLTNAPVGGVDDAGALLETGARVDAELVVWSTGAAPPPLVAVSSLPRSPDGYFAVDATLRATDGSNVWGAGDCVSIEGWDLPKAGVYAVREGPILARNLRAAVVGEEPVRYTPQSDFLSLLNTADGRALLRWKGVAVHNRFAWWLKDRIDRRFVERYRR